MLQNGILAFDRTMKIVNEVYQVTYDKPYGFIKAKNTPSIMNEDTDRRMKE